MSNKLVRGFCLLIETGFGKLISLKAFTKQTFPEHCIFWISLYPSLAMSIIDCCHAILMTSQADNSIVTLILSEWYSPFNEWLRLKYWYIFTYLRVLWLNCFYWIWGSIYLNITDQRFRYHSQLFYLFHGYVFSKRLYLVTVVRSKTR